MAGTPARGLTLPDDAASVAQTQTATPPQDDTANKGRITCESKSNSRQQCPADTSAGVSLLKSTGDAPCVVGRTWGYDATGIWTSDGCGGEFLAGKVAQAQEKKKPAEHIPNLGFLLYDGDEGQIYFRLWTYVRYLNQRTLDPSYVDQFGKTHDVQQRQDIQLQKFLAPFNGWFLTPKFRYFMFVWSQNPAQGLPTQIAAAGSISYTFNGLFTLGGGITSLPTTRSTEGLFPYFLGVDDRLMADEYFRGSYTDGVWAKGELPHNLKYMAMIGNNLSILGVSAAQLSNKLDTQSYMLQWLPTTGEFGLYGTLGDYDDHQMVATRLGAHYTHSFEDRQSQPGTDGIENTQIRLADGNIIFTPNLFGPGTSIESLIYQMTCVDAGVKYRGYSLEGEYYWRWLNDFTGSNVGGLAAVADSGYQLQSSAMVVQKILQAYLSGSQIFSDFGNPSEIRAGINWYFRKTRGLRFNAEVNHLNHSPVGYAAFPYPVGANGTMFHLNVEMNF